MSKTTNFRFYVEDGQASRSAVWTVTIARNDIYVTSGIGGKSSKISLHESGSYQWSLRSEVVKAGPPYVPATGRHLAAWASPKAPAGHFTHEFFVLIPASELRADNSTTGKKASRLASPGAGLATLVDFFLSPPSLRDDVRIEPEPFFWGRLEDGRILLLHHRTIPIDDRTAQGLRSAKADAWRTQQEQGEANAFALGRLTAPTGVSGMAEFAPEPPLMVFRSPSAYDKPRAMVPPREVQSQVNSADESSASSESPVQDELTKPRPSGRQE